MKFKEGDRCTYNQYCGMRFITHTGIIMRIQGMYATVRRDDGERVYLHLASLY